MIQEFSINNIVAKLKSALNSEIMNMKMLEEVAEKMRNHPIEFISNLGKVKNNQNEQNDKLKNPNAYYKSLAYAARIEKEMDDKDRLEKKKVGIDIDYEDSFENLYLRKLKGQMKVEDKTNYDQYLFERRKKLEKGLGKYKRPVNTTEAEKLSYAEKIGNSFVDDECNVFFNFSGSFKEE